MLGKLSGPVALINAMGVYLLLARLWFRGGGRVLSAELVGLDHNPEQAWGPPHLCLTPSQALLPGESHHTQ